MIIRRYNPQSMLDTIADAFDLSEDFNRLFNFSDFAGPANKWGLFEGDWSPRLDVFEDDDSYFIKVDVPGIEAKDIELNLTNDVLTIKGERRQGVKEDEGRKKGRKYQREERIYGTFHRTIPLPMPVETNKVDATLKDGVLSIKIAKREETKPRRIRVKV